MTIPLDLLEIDLRSKTRPVAAKAPPCITEFETKEAQHCTDIKRVGHADDRHTSHFQHPVDLFHRLRSTFKMLKYLLQGDAIETAIIELQVINAHLPEAGSEFGKNELRDPDVVFEIVDADDALAGKPSFDFGNKVSGVASDVQQPLALQQIKHLKLPIAQFRRAENVPAFVGRKIFTVHQVGFRRWHQVV